MDEPTQFLLFEAFLRSHKDYLFFCASMISVLLITAGWFVNGSMNRTLQKRQLAISILHDNRYEPVWVNATHSLFSKFHDDRYTEDKWLELAKKAYNGNHTLTSDESDDLAEIRTVVNTFEFVATAINCDSIDELVIKDSWAHFFKMVYVNLNGFINQGRELKNEPNLHINFTDLTLKWFPELKPKEGRASKRSIFG